MSIVDSTSAGIYLLRSAQGETVIENTGPLTIRQSSGNGANQNIFFKTGASVGTEVTAMTIDGSQRVGIGTTSPGAPLEVIGTAGTISARASTSVSSLAIQIYNNGTDSFIDSTAYGAGSGGAIAFRRNGTTELGRWDTSGRLLVGTSSTSAICTSVISGRSDSATANPVLRLDVNNTSPSDDAALGNIIFGTSGQSAYDGGAYFAAFRDGGTWTNTSSHPTRLSFWTTADGASSPTERMRITNGGWLKASNSGAYFDAVAAFHELRSNQNNAVVKITDSIASGYTDAITVFQFTAYAPNNTTARFLYCGDATAERCTIRSNGGIANFSANNVNLSDRNAKKDIAPASDTWDCLKQWEIVNFRYKDQPDDADLNLGVIAQQVAESCPEVITVFQEAKEATEDQPAQEERIGVKEQQMMWMAIKALQEAQTRIETLEAEVAALKGA